jgi:hypothetical protein
VPVVHGGTPVDVDPNVIGGEWARHEAGPASSAMPATGSHELARNRQPAKSRPAVTGSR